MLRIVLVVETFERTESSEVRVRWYIKEESKVSIEEVRSSEEGKEGGMLSAESDGDSGNDGDGGVKNEGSSIDI